MHDCLFSFLNLAEAQHWQTTVQINAADKHGIFLDEWLHVRLRCTKVVCAVFEKPHAIGGRPSADDSGVWKYS